MVQCLIWDSLNSSVYRDYLKDHFIKFIRRREPHEYLLLIVDGHKSHISVDLIDWAKEQKIILFVLQYIRRIYYSFLMLPVLVWSFPKDI